MAKVKRMPPKKAGDVLAKAPKAKADDAPAFALPTDLSEPSDSLQDYSILLYGAKKIGKTTLASMFPGAYFLMTEPGGRALRIYQTPVTTWKTAKDALRALEKNPGKFRTVVVDTVDMLYQLCFAHVGKIEGWDHPSEEAWGKGWAALRKELSDYITRLMALPMGVVLISHATEKEVQKRDGTKYDRIQPTMSGMARDLVEAMVDIWMYYDYDGEERVLLLQGDDHIAAGHRLQEHFRAPDGVRYVRSVPMGNAPEVGFKNLMAAFDNTLPVPDDVDEPPPAVAAPKAVKKMGVKKKAKA
jgi:hypothetical protein